MVQLFNEDSSSQQVNKEISYKQFSEKSDINNINNNNNLDSASWATSIINKLQNQNKQTTKSFSCIVMFSLLVFLVMFIIFGVILSNLITEQVDLIKQKNDQNSTLYEITSKVIQLNQTIQYMDYMIQQYEGSVKNLNNTVGQQDLLIKQLISNESAYEIQLKKLTSNIQEDEYQIEQMNKTTQTQKQILQYQPDYSLSDITDYHLNVEDFPKVQINNLNATKNHDHFMGLTLLSKKHITTWKITRQHKFAEFWDGRICFGIYGIGNKQTLSIENLYQEGFLPTKDRENQTISYYGICPNYSPEQFIYNNMKTPKSTLIPSNSFTLTFDPFTKIFTIKTEWELEEQISAKIIDIENLYYRPAIGLWTEDQTITIEY